MQERLDPVLSARQKLGKAKSFDFVQLLAYLAVFAFSFFMFTWEFQFDLTDLRVHARIASEFDFSDLHTITSRLAYPMWHLIVAIFYQLGMPLITASALVCTLSKIAGMWLMRKLLVMYAGDKVSRHIITLCSFVLMFVATIRIPSVNQFVYKGIGSPTVWHNPTQLMVIVSMLLCIPYTAHLWYEFERRLPDSKEKTMLPWHQIIILALLLMFSLACKPTFMQAFLPAAFVFFLVQWIRHPKNSRYFVQIIVAFIPAAGYFLLQYLYYTGVLVPFTSGVAFGATWESTWYAVRNLAMMAAFPLYAIICCYKKGMMRDKMLVLALLMTAFSVLEACFFSETGLREGHGNFFWANMTSAVMLWPLMLGKFVASFADFCRAEHKPWYRFLLFGIGFSLLAWHIYSGGYYIRHLLISHNSF